MLVNAVTGIISFQDFIETQSFDVDAFRQRCFSLGKPINLRGDFTIILQLHNDGLWCASVKDIDDAGFKEEM